MSIARWPFHDNTFHWPEDVIRAFSPFFSTEARRSAGVFPLVNLYDDGESFLVRVEVPGLDKEALEVSVKGDQLTLRGERKTQPPAPNASHHRRERDSGLFRRVVTLPQAVDSEKIQATYKNGVLEVVLPRLPQAQPRKISVS